MSHYFFDLVGVDEDDIGAEFRSPSEARSAAIVYLGEYLRDDPNYATQGHWQVNVYDDSRSLLFNIVVATVNVRAVKSLL